MSKRIKAFLIHLISSSLLAFLTLILVFYIWYPSPLHIATGVSHIFLIMLAADVSIGPVLTLLVYKVGKKSLRFDLTVIIIVQLCVFSYGLHTVAIARPAWIVFNVDRFDLVQANDIDLRKVSKAKKNYQQVSWRGPAWASAKFPTDKKEREQIFIESVKGGYDIPQRPDLYLPLSESLDIIRNKSNQLIKLNEFNNKEAVQQILLAWPKANAWLPLKGNIQDMVVLINKKDGRVISIVNLKPWK
ncbi:TfpX/TfpZ family type IV pilin accessory protein [Aquirhabdus sp.]|uniref:TfpX/TfpZ family type IV pilin accessory protein n=1 Tax=Aquirhabdus sp. TaxID=2824160 RepID=UPI00396CFE78